MESQQSSDKKTSTKLEADLNETMQLLELETKSKLELQTKWVVSYFSSRSHSLQTLFINVTFTFSVLNFFCYPFPFLSLSLFWLVTLWWVWPKILEKFWEKANLNLLQFWLVSNVQKLNG